MFWRGSKMYRRLATDVATAVLPEGPGNGQAITEADLEPLPPAVQRYFRAMGVVGHPRDWSFQAHFTGRFRLRPGQAWAPCETWQYSSALEVARIFHMRIDFAGLLPMIGSDTYVHGHGRMHGKLLGLVTVADGQGPEADISELVTYLNDAVLMAPSTLLGPAVSFLGAGEDAFDITLTNAGTSVTARVLLDPQGLPRDFVTTDRYAVLAGGPVRARWSTPVDAWQRVDGRMIVSHAVAMWDLPDGPFTYADFTVAPGDVVFNVTPGEPVSHPDLAA